MSSAQKSRQDGKELRQELFRELFEAMDSDELRFVHLRLTDEMRKREIEPYGFTSHYSIYEIPKSKDDYHHVQIEWFLNKKNALKSVSEKVQEDGCKVTIVENNALLWDKHGSVNSYVGVNGTSCLLNSHRR